MVLHLSTFSPRSPSVLTELLLLLRWRQGLCLTERFSDKYIFFYCATTAFSLPFQFSSVFVTFFLHLHLLHIYSLSTSHHQSIWHLLRAPLLLPVPVLFIMASPRSPTSAGLRLLPLTSLCHMPSSPFHCPKEVLYHRYTHIYAGLWPPKVPLKHSEKSTVAL